MGLSRFLAPTTYFVIATSARAQAADALQHVVDADASRGQRRGGGLSLPPPYPTKSFLLSSRVAGPGSDFPLDCGGSRLHMSSRRRASPTTTVKPLSVAPLALSPTVSARPTSSARAEEQPVQHRRLHAHLMGRRQQPPRVLDAQQLGAHLAGRASPRPVHRARARPRPCHCLDGRVDSWPDWHALLASQPKAHPCPSIIHRPSWVSRPCGMAVQG